MKDKKTHSFVNILFQFDHFLKSIHKDGLTIILLNLSQCKVKRPNKKKNENELNNSTIGMEYNLLGLVFLTLYLKLEQKY